MDECIKNCGECPFFERYVYEYEAAIDSEVGKGTCNKFCEDNILEIKMPCNYAEQMIFSELEEEFNSDFKIGF